MLQAGKRRKEYRCLKLLSKCTRMASSFLEGSATKELIDTKLTRMTLLQTQKLLLFLMGCFHHSCVRNCTIRQHDSQLTVFTVCSVCVCADRSELCAGHAGCGLDDGFQVQSSVSVGTQANRSSQPMVSVEVPQLPAPTFPPSLFFLLFPGRFIISRGSHHGKLPSAGMRHVQPEYSVGSSLQICGAWKKSDVWRKSCNSCQDCPC